MRFSGSDSAVIANRVSHGRVPWMAVGSRAAAPEAGASFRENRRRGVGVERAGEP